MSKNKKQEVHEVINEYWVDGLRDTYEEKQFPR